MVVSTPSSVCKDAAGADVAELTYLPVFCLS